MQTHTSVSDERSRTAEAKNCDSCLEWHKHCNAECCRIYRILAEACESREFKKGDIIRVKHWLTASEQWYYNLHGERYRNGVRRVRLKNFYVDGEYLYIVRDCDILTPDGQCLGHPDRKPLPCRELTAETYGGEQFYNTPNCLFKYKKKRVK